MVLGPQPPAAPVREDGPYVSKSRAAAFVQPTGLAALKADRSHAIHLHGSAMHGVHAMQPTWNSSYHLVTSYHQVRKCTNLVEVAMQCPLILALCQIDRLCLIA